MCGSRHNAGPYSPHTVSHQTQLHSSSPSRTPHAYSPKHVYPLAGQNIEQSEYLQIFCILVLFHV